MFEVIFLIVLALVWIVFAVVQDLKKREIANWLNFSLIIFALAFRLFYSVFSESGFGFFYHGLIGFGIFFVLGNVFYYVRLFAGGDAKLMIALGAVLPFSEVFSINMQSFAYFLIIFLISGAVYGLIFTFSYIIRNYGMFKIEFLKKFKKNKKFFYLSISLSIVLILLSFFESILLVLAIFVFILPYFYFSAKAIDEVFMIKEIKTGNLTEGDWLYKDIKVGRKLIKASWDGLTKEDIKLIKKKYKTILIRNGIPFGPVFLISYIIFILSWSGILWKSFW